MIKTFFLSLLFLILVLSAIVGYMVYTGRDIPCYVRDPVARLVWSDGENKDHGAVYWKPFSDEYIAEIDQGSDLFLWASIDCDSETVGSPNITGRIGGFLLFSNGELESVDSENDETVGDWRSAFSSKMVTFNNERYRCKVEF